MVEIRCPYCHSKGVISDEEHRFCCLFEHGKKTLNDLSRDIVKNMIERFKIRFECVDCGREFYVIYEATEVK